MRRFAVTLLGCVLLAGCSDEGEPVAPGSPAPVSFIGDVQPIFDARCIVCHGAEATAGMDLRAPQSHGNIVGVQATSYPALRVAPFDPGASVLYDKVSGGGMYGEQMPQGGPPLSTAQIETIRRWIAEGAVSE